MWRPEFRIVKELALASLEPRLALVDDVYSAFAADDAVVAVARLGRFQ